MPNTREKLIELLRDVQYLGGLEEKVADHLISNGVTVVDKFATTEQEWISVKVRLPESFGERVLVKLKNFDNIIGNPAMDTDRYSGISWVRWNGHVTHWMPLPEPPKEG